MSFEFIVPSRLEDLTDGADSSRFVLWINEGRSDENRGKARVAAAAHGSHARLLCTDQHHVQGHRGCLLLWTPRIAALLS